MQSTKHGAWHKINALGVSGEKESWPGVSTPEETGGGPAPAEQPLA